MASMQASPWLPELEVTKKSPCAIFFSWSSSGLYIYEDKNNKIRNERVSSRPHPHLPLCHFGQFAVSPSQLEAACSLLLKDVEYWLGVGDRVKRSSKKKTFACSIFKKRVQGTMDDIAGEATTLGCLDFINWWKCNMKKPRNLESLLFFLRT